jgi:hypothetical protein
MSASAFSLQAYLEGQGHRGPLIIVPSSDLFILPRGLVFCIQCDLCHISNHKDRATPSANPYRPCNQNSRCFRRDRQVIAAKSWDVYTGGIVVCVYAGLACYNVQSSVSGRGRPRSRIRSTQN